MTLSKRFVIYGQEHAAQLLAFVKANAKAMADAGRPLAVTVEEHKAKRSNAQNRRYWALLRQISESAFVNGRQYGDDAWHEFFKRRFIGLEELPGGHESGISTATLDVAGFGEYMEQIEAYAATDLGIELL